MVEIVAPPVVVIGMSGLTRLLLTAAALGCAIQPDALWGAVSIYCTAVRNGQYCRFFSFSRRRFPRGREGEKTMIIDGTQYNLVSTTEVTPNKSDKKRKSTDDDGSSRS